MWPAGRTNFSISQATPHYMAVLQRVIHTLLRWYSSANLGIANRCRLAGWNLAQVADIMGVLRLSDSPFNVQRAHSPECVGLPIGHAT